MPGSVEKGYVKKMDQAFKKILKLQRTVLPEKREDYSEHAMKMLRDCKASPILAHPYQYHLGDKKTEELVFLFKGYGTSWS